MPASGKRGLTSSSLAACSTEAIASLDAATIDRAIIAGETAVQASQTPLFGNLPEHEAPAAAAARPTKLGQYRLKIELGVPRALWQEHPLPPQVLNDPAFIDSVARAFCERSQLTRRTAQPNEGASLSLRDLFLEGDHARFRLSLHLERARCREAQQAFQLNNSIDPRLLERALIAALRDRATTQPDISSRMPICAAPSSWRR